MITRNLQATLLRSSYTPEVNLKFKAQLSYDPDRDPFAVALILIEPMGRETEWSVGRELLLTGIDSLEPAGEGDVKIWYDERLGKSVICLDAESGHADVAIPKISLHLFLKQTLSSVPLGAENCDALLDAAIEEILECY